MRVGWEERQGIKEQRKELEEWEMKDMGDQVEGEKIL